MSGSFGGRVRAALLAASCAEVREGHERYFKGTVRFHGVRAPQVKLIARRFWPELAARGDSAVVAEAFALIVEPYQEEKQIAVALLGRVARRLPPAFLGTFEPVFDRGVHDWATCDGVSGHVLRTLVKRDPATRRRMLRWSRHRNLWRQRASAVAWVNDAEHGEFTDEILAIAANVLRNPERFAQLGAGWVLRELTLADRSRTLAFIAGHRERISREALRYAVEKLPTEVRARVLSGESPGARRPLRGTARRAAGRRKVAGRLAGGAG